jgi:hypothetical protein
MQTSRVLGARKQYAHCLHIHQATKDRQLLCTKQWNPSDLPRPLRGMRCVIMFSQCPESFIRQSNKAAVSLLYYSTCQQHARCSLPAPNRLRGTLNGRSECSIDHSAIENKLVEQRNLSSVTKHLYPSGPIAAESLQISLPPLPPSLLFVGGSSANTKNKLSTQCW